MDVYPGVEREDEMVAAFDYCLHGKGGAAPSIDTAMHGLVDAPHIDHLHPDSGIALATAADGEALTKECFGDRVAWVDWRRPGFQLGLDIAEVKRNNPQAIGVVLGGHGITAWGATSEECEANSLDIIRTAETFLAEHGKAEPFGAVVPGFEALPVAERHAKAAALAPVVRGLASTDAPQLGHYTDSDAVLEFLSREKLVPLAELGTSCPDHFLRTKVRPAGRRPARRRPRVEETVVRLRELHVAYREEYAAYYDRNKDAGQPGHARRRPGDRAGARCRDVLVRQGQADRSRSRRVLRQRDQRDARRRGRLDVRTDRREREVPHRVLVARGGEAPADAEAEAAGRTGRARHRRRLRDRQGHRGAARRRRRLRRGRRPRRGRAPPRSPTGIGSTDRAIAVVANVTDADAVQAAVDAAALAFGGVDLVVNNAGLSISKPLLETTEKDWDLQHDVMAKGSFLVSRAAARAMVDQADGRRHRLHLLEELGLRRTRTTSPTARPRPTRPTRCGCSRPSSASTASGSTA